VKEFDCENALDVTEGFINLQDWMAKIQEIVLRKRVHVRTIKTT
jgi:hypothetical protein